MTCAGNGVLRPRTFVFSGSGSHRCACLANTYSPRGMWNATFIKITIVSMLQLFLGVLCGINILLILCLLKRGRGSSNPSVKDSIHSGTRFIMSFQEVIAQHVANIQLVEVVGGEFALLDNDI